MPVDLRAHADQAAKSSGRSLNAELVARLEASFMGDASISGPLITAGRARELALMARSGIPNEIRKRVIESINKAVSVGHSEAFVALTDLHLVTGIPDDDLEEIQKVVIDELESSGYKVKWDDITTIFIEF
jgi:hypothetical protein